jgi:hypothetical protein
MFSKYRGKRRVGRLLKLELGVSLEFGAWNFELFAPGSQLQRKW